MQVIREWSEFEAPQAFSTRPSGNREWSRLIPTAARLLLFRQGRVLDLCHRDGGDLLVRAYVEGTKRTEHWFASGRLVRALQKANSLDVKLRRFPIACPFADELQEVQAVDILGRVDAHGVGSERGLRPRLTWNGGRLCLGPFIEVRFWRSRFHPVLIRTELLAELYDHEPDLELLHEPIKIGRTVRVTWPARAARVPRWTTATQQPKPVSLADLDEDRKYHRWGTRHDEERKGYSAALGYWELLKAVGAPLLWREHLCFLSWSEIEARQRVELDDRGVIAQSVPALNGSLLDAYFGVENLALEPGQWIFAHSFHYDILWTMKDGNVRGVSKAGELIGVWLPFERWFAMQYRLWQHIYTGNVDEHDRSVMVEE